jgi:hypothetical protein
MSGHHYTASSLPFQHLELALSLILRLLRCVGIADRAVSSRISHCRDMLILLCSRLESSNNISSVVFVVVHAADGFIAEDGFLFTDGCGEGWVLPHGCGGTEVVGHDDDGLMVVRVGEMNGWVGIVKELRCS